MMALLLEPLQFTFMSHALLISLVVSIPCALLSVFLVLKGWALMGDAMSHARGRTLFLVHERAFSADEILQASGQAFYRARKPENDLRR